MYSSMVFGWLILVMCVTLISPLDVNQCGRRKTSRIVGGTTTKVNEFPMMAGLVNIRAKSVFCGATIVSRTAAVTAAHCFGRLTVTEVTLLVGDHDYSTGADTKYAKSYGLSHIVRHFGYRGGDNDDIAIVRTRNAIQYNAGVGPACLPTNNDQMVGKMVEVVGWGTTSFGGPKSHVLKKALVKVISNTECKKSWGNRIQRTEICTFTRGKDSCQHDSGGPLYRQSYGRIYLTGIVTYGDACAGKKPGVSTRVANYVSWIRANS